VSLAQPSAEKLAGLHQKVAVTRDARGIPYINAENDRDLYFTQGYITASDRLWQMELLRRVARGETAEIFGRAALEEDKRWRRFDFATIAEQSIKLHSSELRAALEAYAEGVNAYLAEQDPANLPPEFKMLQFRPRKWTTTDTLIVGKILSDALSTTWRNDLARAEGAEKLSREKLDDLSDPIMPEDVILFGPDGKTKAWGVGEPGLTAPNEEVIAAADRMELLRRRSLELLGLFAEQLSASNNWVISGKRTADGKPILANDPHLSPTSPGIWYMAHLSAPGLRVAGVSIPGVPGIVIGHNEHIAWGSTNVGPDVQDLVIETFGEDGKYRVPGGWAQPVVRVEKIKVKKDLLGTETETVDFPVTVTRNGPIIFEGGGKSYSLKWTAMDSRNIDFEAFFRANRAKNWDEFRAAARLFRGPTQNFVYADVKGNIGWQVAGSIPVRKAGSGAVPYDGSTDDGEWIASIPFEELPSLYNPPEGFIVTANQRIVGTSYRYPQFNRDFAAPWRARRLYDLLRANSKVTIDDVMKYQFDHFDIPLERLAKLIVAAGAADEGMLAELKAWDGLMTPGSRGALIVNQIRNCMAGKIADDNKPGPLYLIRERALVRDLGRAKPIWLPKQFADYPALMRACSKEGNSALEARLGADRTKWTWGSSFQSRFSHPLAAAPLIGAQFAAPSVGIHGSGQSPNVGSAVSMRFVAVPGKWDTTRMVIPLGQSGRPDSPNYRDQFDPWRTGVSPEFPFSPEAVARATVTAKTLEPAAPK
jgi:penicillin G amidase